MRVRLLAIGPGHQNTAAPVPLDALACADVTRAEDPLDALVALKTSVFDVVLALFPMPGWSPEELLEEVQRVSSFLPVVVWDRSPNLDDAVRLTRLGVWQYLGPDAGASELDDVLLRAAGYHRDRETALFGAERSREPWRSFLVGASKSIEQVHQVVRLVGSRKATVLITGETGTGKEMVARAIHMAGPRSHLLMVAVNCSALPENLLEAELFGHVKGAFTGAVNQRIGRFEQAHRSTIFLDEISDMPLDLQAKLLRVLQEREFQRLGSSETIKVDVRVLAATNVDLLERVRQGRFREDLYYRLNVVPLAVPPLRERLRDVPLLIHHFIRKICRQEDLPDREISADTLARLTGYDWPGNVRQLENAVEMAIALSGDRTVLYPSDFPLPSPASAKQVPATSTPIIAVPDDGLDFERIVGGIERAILEQALRKSGGNKKQAADMLRLKRTTFSAKWKNCEHQGARFHTCAG